jgi:ribosomal protein S8
MVNPAIFSYLYNITQNLLIMNSMTTMTEVLNNLYKEGYTTDFNLNDNCIVCRHNMLEMHPDDFTVDRHYRFEGATDPGDESIVYAISSEKHGIKGVLVNGYGLYSDPLSDAMIRKLKAE